jgi:hypothetical protein
VAGATKARLIDRGGWCKMAAVDGDTPDLLPGLQPSCDIIESIVAPARRRPAARDGVARRLVLDAQHQWHQAGGGETGWDHHEALAGMDSMFDIDGIGTVEDVTHLGLAVFGHNAPNPGDQKISPTTARMKDNPRLGSGPVTSCGWLRRSVGGRRSPGRSKTARSRIRRCSTIRPNRMPR